MLVDIITKEDFEVFAEPLLKELKALRHEVVINRILIKDQYWIPRKTTELILDVSPNTLKVNAEKWGIRYRKGKLFIDYWLPDIVEYLKGKHLKIEAIEARIQAAINAI